MTALSTIAFGAASDGSQGDTVRTAFTKVNANTTVLGTQAALTSATAVTVASALTPAQVGRRVSISLAAAGVIQLPQASLCTADSIIHLRNTGATVVTLAGATGAGDTVALSKLNPGESAIFDTDGVHTWSVLVRGRANSDNESVIGTLTVGGSVVAAGNGSLGFLGGAFSFAANTFINASSAALIANDTSGSNTSNVIFQSNGVTLWNIQKTGANALVIQRSVAGAIVDNPISIATATGITSFSQRPVFAGNTPYDSGNLNFATPPAIGGTTPASGKFTTLQATGTITPSSTAGIVGTTTNNNANAGSVGEYVSSTSGAVALTTATNINATSIVLSAGDWEVSGSCAFAGTSVNISQAVAGASSVSATLPALPLYAAAVTNGASLIEYPIFAIPPQRFLVSGPTTIYGVAAANFSTGAGTVTATFNLRARRVR
ncbi:hypothetical protein [Pararobbsia alpina]|uniref:Uncharacterized protein n=1 Tax=Pararobbsia alpina TaxID=621374 RepID=A0A6S7BCM2_9BURK|nr:hypothetical protein [Pararobbsia alpina]CAB3795478.1 hypothetical protein LMG28138_03888 [Pararobbsia alpina]